jgi:hypothetical protein
MLKFICDFLAFRRPINSPKMDLKEELESLAESDSIRRSKNRSKSSLALGLLGWLIIGSTLNAVIFSSLPLKIATIEWQLNLVGSLLTSSFNFLIGFALIIIAQLFNAKEKILQKWQVLVSRLAAWFAIVLLLIVPLQFFSGFRAVRQQGLTVAKAISNLNVIVNRVGAVNSEPELRAYLASLPNPPTLPSKFDAPFPVIKQRVIDNIKSQINLVTNNADRQKSQALQTFLKDSVRNTAQAILMATAFSILANLSSRTANVVTRFIYSLL